jgi:hypothetical protein
VSQCECTRISVLEIQFCTKESSEVSKETYIIHELFLLKIVSPGELLITRNEFLGGEHVHKWRLLQRTCNQKGVLLFRNLGKEDSRGIYAREL